MKKVSLAGTPDDLEIFCCPKLIFLFQGKCLKSFHNDENTAMYVNHYTKLTTTPQPTFDIIVRQAWHRAVLALYTNLFLNKSCLVTLF